MKENLHFKQLQLNYILVLLFFNFWLRKASLTFCQINTVMSAYMYKTLHWFKWSKNITALFLCANFHVKKYWHERILVLKIENKILKLKIQVFL